MDCSPALDLIELSGSFEDFERGDTGGGGEWISRERARLVDGADGRDAIHDLGRSAVGAYRQPAADDLAERNEIGRDAEAILRAAHGDAEAGHDFIEDEQGAVVFGQAA